jgi:predicted transcriptional regulator
MGAMMKNKTTTKEELQTKKPTQAELELLRVLWKVGPCSAKHAHQEAQSERPELAYSAVLRLLQVMHQKGLVWRDESAKAHIYGAQQEAEDLKTNLVKDLIEKAFAGSAKALVLAALRTKISAKERAEIQQLLDEEN